MRIKCVCDWWRVYHMRVPNVYVGKNLSVAELGSDGSRYQISTLVVDSVENLVDGAVCVRCSDFKERKVTPWCLNPRDAKQLARDFKNKKFYKGTICLVGAAEDIINEPGIALDDNGEYYDVDGEGLPSNASLSGIYDCLCSIKLVEVTVNVEDLAVRNKVIADYRHMVEIGAGVGDFTLNKVIKLTNAGTWRFNEVGIEDIVRPKGFSFVFTPSNKFESWLVGFLNEHGCKLSVTVNLFAAGSGMSACVEDCYSWDDLSILFGASREFYLIRSNLQGGVTIFEKNRNNEYTFISGDEIWNKSAICTVFNLPVRRIKVIKGGGEMGDRVEKGAN